MGCYWVDYIFFLAVAKHVDFMFELGRNHLSSAMRVCIFSDSLVFLSLIVPEEALTPLCGYDVSRTTGAKSCPFFFPISGPFMTTTYNLSTVFD